MSRRGSALLLVSLMLITPLSGCFGEEDSSQEITENDLKVSPSIIPGGEWATINLKASKEMSVFIPYFIQDPGSLRAQNGTVFDLKEGDSVSMNALFPPRNSNIVLLIGNYGRENWPIRASDVCWAAWAACAAARPAGRGARTD